MKEQTKKEIEQLGRDHRCTTLAQRCIREDLTVEDTRALILEDIYGARRVESSGEIGMSARDIQQYSVLNAIRKMAEGRPLDGLESEASIATAKLINRQAQGFFIPQDVLMRRSLTAGVSTAGGFTVDSQVLVGSLIELLRNKPMIAQLGARTLSGLVGNVVIPRLTGAATAYWLAETGTISEADPALGGLGLTPHKLQNFLGISKDFLRQTSPDVENLILEDIITGIAVEKDRCAINGGLNIGEPMGILNTSGILSETFGAAATWAKILDFETQVGNASADLGPALAYLTTPNVRAKWKGATKVTGGSTGFLWECPDINVSMVNGYNAQATKNMPSDRVLFGNFHDIILADWVGIDILVDPYSSKKSGQVEILITNWTDNGVRHAVSFCASTDSGNQ